MWWNGHRNSLPEAKPAAIIAACADRPLRKNDTVSGVVSLGPVMVEVPDVVGMTIPDAVQAIRDVGLVPDLRTNVPEPLQGLAAILSQDPGAPGPVVEGTTIVIDATY